jgi:succinate dehydrogenase / fumarate reductase, iron-sulfur subunit
MVLDALHKVRNEIDPTLAFRRSCREGICGSCSMNIGGGNGLACLTPVEGDGPLSIYPLPHMRVIRDLVPDLSRFFEHYHAMRPQLRAEPPAPDREHRQTPAERERLDGLYECILCACCSSACPSYWWNEDTFPGPAALLQAHRWVSDSRDEERDARLDTVEQPAGVYGCRQILNCAKACPKGLNPAKAIAELRLLLLARKRS